MARKKKPSTLYSVLFMILLAAICTGTLAALNIITAKSIEENGLVDEQKSILKAAGIDAPEEEVKTIFDEKFKKIADEPRIVYKYTDGEKTGYVFHYKGGALWGNVLGYVGITEDMTKLLGVSVYKNNETPGLGGRITEDWYQDQFRELELKGDNFIAYRPSSGGNVDAITGATLTSNSMKDIFNEEIKKFIEEVKGGQYEK